MRHQVSQWYRDAKLGILVRWGVPSVPAYAPSEQGGPLEILRHHNGRFYFRNHPDAQWYLNSLRINESPVRRHHRKHYGDYTAYERFARRFNEELPLWDPTQWAELFREAGARYVVMTAKHHDGFLLWPSRTAPASPSFLAQRDVVGELAIAVRALGMKYGVSYSGLLDWTVQSRPVRDFADWRLARCPGEYPGYVEAHLTELIERTAADVLRIEGGLPAGTARKVLVHAYREAVPDGVLTGCRRQTRSLERAVFGSPLGRRLLSNRIRAATLAGSTATGRAHADVAVVEYPAPVTKRPGPWEYVRGLGRSFGFNAAEPASSYLSGVELVHLLVDVVSKNGNLLLSVAPAVDGSLCREQREALATLARWLATHGEAIYGTRPWRHPEAVTADGLPVRFTSRPDALYAVVLGRPRMLSIEFPDLDLDGVPRSDATNDDDSFDVRVLGLEREIQWREEARSVIVDLPGSFVPAEAIVVKFAWRAAADRAASSFYTDLV